MFGAKFLKNSAPERRATIPDGLTAFAIGDIHGRADLFSALIEEILVDAACCAERPPILVCLGDYVDRGPSSQVVLGALIELSHSDTLETHFLRGNHDQTLLDFLDEPNVGADWCDFGGRETMASYGVTIPPKRGPEIWQTLQQEFASAIPADHVAFLKGLELTYELGDYFFAHAGARPGVPLASQTERDLLWIRQPFLDDRRSFEKVVVHGHTPADEAYSDHRRIGLDTGAYATGVLTAVRLEGEARRLLQTRRLPDGEIKVETQHI
jgi:serine/threonine protein phosphatase 1